MKRIVTTTCAVAATILFSAHAAGAQDVGARDTTIETALLDIVLAPVRSGTVTALRAGDRALLPVAAVLDILEVANTTSETGVVMFTRPSDGTAIRIDRSDRSVQEGRARRVLAERFMESRGDQTLVDAGVLAGLVGVTMNVGWSELQVRVTDADSLPPIQRLHRSSRWARLLSPGPAPLAPDEYRPLDRPFADGAMLDYIFSSPTQGPFRTSAFSTSLGASLFGGSLEAFASGPVEGNGHTVTASWLGVWRENPSVTQLRIGNGLTTGPRPRTVNGFSVGNAPFLRPLEYGTLPVAIRGDSGWEVESYVNGQLVRVDTLHGRNATIPMLARYGSNVIDRIAYGPTGEIRRSQQLLALTAEDLLPAGRFEYGVSGGECQFERCRGTANVDLRYGVTSRFSMRGGLESESDSSHRYVAAPYIGGAYLAPADLTVSGSVLARGEVTGALRWQPSVDQGIVLQRTHQMDNIPFTDVVRGSIRDVTNASAFSQLPWWDKRVQGSAVLLDARSESNSSQSARLGLGVQTEFGQIYPYTEALRLESGNVTTHTSVLGVSVYTLPTRQLGSALDGTWLSATAEWRGDGQRFITTTAARSINDRFRLDMSLTAQANGAPVYGIRFYGDLGKARLLSSNTVTGGQATGSQQLYGSVFVDPHRQRATFTNGPLLDRGGVSGQVYLDMNANGRMDADEQPLVGVTVRVGGVAAVTDSNGFFLTTDVLPFEPVLVQLETASLESPLWVGAFERLMLEPSPNSVRRVDIPVLPGGVVEGRLVRAGADSTQELSGVDIKLEAIGSDRSMTVTTFTDGSFAFLGVAPKRYRLLVESGVWRSTETPVIEVKAAANGDRVRGIVLRATQR